MSSRCDSHAKSRQNSKQPRKIGCQTKQTLLGYGFLGKRQEEVHSSAFLIEKDSECFQDKWVLGVFGGSCLPTFANRESSLIRQNMNTGFRFFRRG